MPKYRVRLEGQNFLFETEGVERALGFYTTRYVEADSPETAELAAVDCVRNDEDLSGVRNDRENPPMIYLEDIAELESLDGIDVPGSGYTFYEMDDDA